MKRMVSLFLALLVTASALFIYAFATDRPTVKIIPDRYEAKAGDRINFKVTVDGDCTEIFLLTAEVGFSDDIFIFETADVCADVEGELESTSSTVTFTYEGEFDEGDSFDLFEFSLKVREDAVDGDYDVYFTDGTGYMSLFDEDGHFFESGIFVKIRNDSANTVASASLTVPSPEKGMSPVLSVTGDGFSGSIEWTPVVSGTFSPNTVYTAKIVITSDEGYVFSDDCQVSINGYSVTPESVGEGEIVVLKTFEKTAADPLGFASGISFDVPDSVSGTAISSISLAAEGGSGEYVFSKVSGPEWLEVSESGVISGIPVYKAEPTFAEVMVSDDESSESITINVGRVLGRTPGSDMFITDGVYDITYDGTDHTERIMSRIDAYGDLTTRGSVTYVIKRNGDETDSIADAGTYSVYASVEGGTVYDASTALVFVRSFTVNPRMIEFSVDDIPAKTYTGEELTFKPAVRDGLRLLTENKDYTLSANCRTDADEYELTISGTGNYSESFATAAFEIKAKNVEIVLDITKNIVYGEATEYSASAPDSCTVPEIRVFFEGISVSYPKSETPPTRAGKYKVTAECTDTNHSGKVETELVIAKKKLTLGGLTIADKPYDKTVSAPVLGTLELVGIKVGDNVSLPGDVTVSAAFKNALIGTDKIVTIEISGLTFLVGEDADNYLLPDTVLTSTADITAPTSPAILAGSGRALGISTIDEAYDGFEDALKVRYPSAESITSSLRRRMRSVIPFSNDNIRTMNISVIDTASGAETGEEAEVFLPYFDDTDINDDFAVLHMNADTGEIRQLAVTKTPYGIEFECASHGPVSVAWRKYSVSHGDSSDGHTERENTVYASAYGNPLTGVPIY